MPTSGRAARLDNLVAFAFEHARPILDRDWPASSVGASGRLVAPLDMGRPEQVANLLVAEEHQPFGEKAHGRLR